MGERSASKFILWLLAGFSSSMAVGLKDSTLAGPWWVVALSFLSCRPLQLASSEKVQKKSREERERELAR